MRGIGEMARASGLSVSALRFYDGAGVLVPAEVDAALDAGGAGQLMLELDGPIQPLAVRVPGESRFSILMPVRK